MCKSIHILMNVLADFFSAKWKENEKSLAQLTEEIQKSAFDAWKNRQPTEKTVRFVVKLTSNHFRFLNIFEKDGKLIVSR